jgi:hypothetical protein
MFEDIGHSSEARTKMKEYLIGTLKVPTASETWHWQPLAHLDPL